eukprot:11175887-Lingulodinium_polyedra.AAC.1
MAQVAQGVSPDLPPAGAAACGERREVYTDGACVDPLDPLPARAAWAIVVPGVGGGTWAGPVDGPQTAQRGELYAALAALTAVTGLIHFLTDN